MSALPDRLRINYEPPGPVSKAFLESQAFVRGIRGPFGSGKSTLCCIDILDLALRQCPSPDGKRRSRWAIVRQTYPELKTTTIKTWHTIVPENLGTWQGEGPPTHWLQSDDLDIEVMFIALDSPADVKKLLSMDLTGAWVNEAREVPKEVIDGLTARVGRYPSKAQGGPSWFGVTMDTNSPDTDHWWYILAEQDDSTDFGRQLLESTRKAEEALRVEGLLRENQPLFEFFAQPGGMTPEAENRSNLPAGYYQRLMAGKTEDWIKVYVHGEYGFLREGKPVHPQYVDSVHCAKEELKPMKGIKAKIGLDFGLDHAAAFAQQLPNGRWIVFDELVEHEMGTERFAPLLKRKCSEYSGIEFDIVGDPSGDERTQTDENTVYAVLRANKVMARPASTNDKSIRRQALERPLSRLIHGKPGIMISPKCKVLRKGLAGAFCYKRIQVSGERYKLEPDKNEFSHICEALEYALMEGGEKASIPVGQPVPTKPIVHRQAWNVFDR